MYGGENSGMPLGPDPVNNGTGTFGADNNYDQPAAIVSGGEDGGAVAFDSNNKNSNAKYFGRRSREKAAKSSAPQLDAGYVAASNIANNPNNPEFFRQAALENAPAPVAKPRKSRKGMLVGIAIITSIVVIIAVVTIIASISSGANYSDGYASTFEGRAEKYVDQIFGIKDENRDFLKEIDESNFSNYDLSRNIQSTNNENAENYYSRINETLTQLGDTVGKLAVNDDAKNMLKISIDSSKYELFIYYEISRVIYGTNFDSMSVSAIDEYKTKLESEKDNFSKERSGNQIFNTLIKYVERKRELATIYSRYGCYQNNKLNNECASMIDNEAFSNIGKTDAYIDILGRYANDSRRYIYYSSITIYSMAKEGK